MSFSIVSALVLLMTLGQIFLKDGEFKRHFALHEVPQAVELLRASCRMIMEEQEIKQMNVDALMILIKEGVERQETMVREQIEVHCNKQNFDFAKLNGPDIPPPACDKEAALLAIQEDLPKVASPVSAPLEIFKDFDMKDAIELYDFLCSPTPVNQSPSNVSLNKVLELYNHTMEESWAVDLNEFNQPILPQSSIIYSKDGREIIGEIFGREGRRTWVPLSQTPEVVKQAFISAEDKNFYNHKGIELRGVLRGFLRYMQDKTIVGGSTLTQQVVKNLVLTNDITLERKVKEMIIASRLEKLLTKDKILEIYLNLINLGRNSWGIQTAAENYFGDEKRVSELGLNEASFLAGVTHSPNRYEPELHQSRIKDRQQFVLKEMKENGYITSEDASLVDPLKLTFVERKILQSSYFHKAVEEDVKKRLDPADAKHGGLYLFSTQIPSVQKAMEKGLQDRLYQYELSRGRIKWNGPLGNVLTKNYEEMDVFEIAEFHDIKNWTARLTRFKALYRDIFWSLAVVLDKSGNQILIGTTDANGKALTTDLFRNYKTQWGNQALASLKVGDVIFVEEQKGNYALRIIPEVQGAAIAMEAKTGKVIAVSGGFSFHSSELNRALHSYRQPGSSVKPFTYLAALNMGIQPNEVLPNAPIRFDPLYLAGEKKVRRNMRCNAWSVRNYSSSGPASMTLRRALETSNNRVTAHLLKVMWPSDPEMSLNMVRDIYSDFGIYDDPQECYPVILGSQETNLIRLAAAYGAIANGGTLVEPHFLDVEKNAGLLKQEPQQKVIYSVDQISAYQLKNILSGAVARGTGTALKEFDGKVAGKTGTSSSYNDAWFMGFSNDIVVGVWVGYDNGTGDRANLGGGATGGSLAAPIAKAVFEEAFKYYPPTPLINNPPAGIRLYDMGGYAEAFRGEYRDGVYHGLSSSPSTTDWNNHGFFFDEDPIYPDPDEFRYQTPERESSLSPEAERSIRRGQGGLY